MLKSSSLRKHLEKNSMVSCSHGKKVIPYDAAVNPDMNLMGF